MKTLKILIIALLAVSSNNLALGQIQEKAIQAVGRAYTDSIVLRWAPTSPAIWQFLNEYGYHVSRQLILQDGKFLSDQPVERLTVSPVLPAGEEAWTPLLNENDLAAIAAQAIFGESFQLTNNYQGDLLQVINASKELEQRFSFALMASDLSAITANLSGLRFTDDKVNKNEKYLYKIYPAKALPENNADTAMVYLSPTEVQQMPTIKQFEVEFNNRTALLKWNKLNYENIYVAYRIERSADGNNFTSITSVPIINTEAPEGYKPDMMFKIDSLPENEITYYYRVRGINAFAETGPPSDVVSGKGFVPLTISPAIRATTVDGNKITITWEYDKNSENLVNHFKLLRAAKNGGKFDTLIYQIAPDLRQVIDSDPLPVNFYQILAMGNRGQFSVSFPVMETLPDNIPPAIPTGLSATADTTGIVKIKWDANQEADIKGYKIYRANYRQDEFLQVNIDPVTQTEYNDTVALANLTRKLFYKIEAIDQNFNRSGFSDVLAVDKPDIIPPVSPVLKSVVPQGNGIRLQWAVSSSSDVASHLLYRKSSIQTDWQLVYNGDAFNNDHVDSLSIEEATFYQYTLLARDSSGLESPPCFPVKVQSLNLLIKKPVEKIKTRVDRTAGEIALEWKYGMPQVNKFVIYRGLNEKPMSWYRSLAADNLLFVDDQLQESTIYTYRLKAIFSDGSESALSEKVIIKY